MTIDADETTAGTIVMTIDAISNTTRSISLKTDTPETPTAPKVTLTATGYMPKHGQVVTTDAEIGALNPVFKNDVWAKKAVFGEAKNVNRPCKAVIRPCKPVNGIILEKIWRGLWRFVGEGEIGGGFRRKLSK